MPEDFVKHNVVENMNHCTIHVVTVEKYDNNYDGSDNDNEDDDDKEKVEDDDADDCDEAGNSWACLLFVPV